MTYIDAISELRSWRFADPDVISAITEHVDEIERRYADRQAVRLGHIVRHALTPERYYQAERAAAAEHPEAWAGVYFKAEEGGEL